APEAKPVTATVEEKPPQVFVTPRGPEIRLTIGGFIQAQVEAGDVSAFEGRFPGTFNQINDRFRVRRARIGITGEYAEQFDFKVEGDFGLNDAALTVRDPATGRTIATNTTRT